MIEKDIDRELWQLGAHDATRASWIARWSAAGVGRRLWARDPSLWFPDPRPELTDRLGWLSLPRTPRAALEEIDAVASAARAEGVRDVVLLGMGGSSLAPEVFQSVFGAAPGYPSIRVADTTHPDAVHALAARLDLPRTWFVLASKSGTTLESLSLYRIFWSMLRAADRSPGAHFLAITDPGTPLEKLAAEKGFRHVFRAPPDVGGRYSALSVFGLVPLALMGRRPATLLERAAALAAESGPEVPEAESPGVALGAALGGLALHGCDKVTFVASSALAAFPAWIEQLIAESTGKEGKGIVPVVDEPLGPATGYGDDRFFVGLSFAAEPDRAMESCLDSLAAAGHPVVRFRLTDPYDLGAEILRWEMAVALAGAALGIHPFDQPDVQLAKDLARKAMQHRGPSASAAVPVASARDAARAWLETARPHDYLCVQAYLAPTEETTSAIQQLRRRLRDRLRIATTFGYGPRFLHSTGQLHKGGAPNGLFLQLIDDPERNVQVPETDFTLGELILAQAQGDFDALLQRRRRVLRLSLGSDVGAGLRVLADLLS